MRNLPAFNFPLFDEVAGALRSLGFTIISPADHDRQVIEELYPGTKPEDFTGYATGDFARYFDSVTRGGEFSLENMLGWDFARIIESNGIIMLPGWERSTGATHERYVAEALGKPVFHAKKQEAWKNGLSYWAVETQTKPRVIPLTAPGTAAIYDGAKVTAEVNDDGIAAESVRSFDTGATRDTDNGKYDFEGFISPLVLWEYADYMHRNRVQSNGELRASDNWQKGIPLDAYIQSLLRHVMDLWMLHRNHPPIRPENAEIATFTEALGGLLFNAMGYWHEYLRSLEDFD
jgi:hypothetical protein